MRLLRAVLISTVVWTAFLSPGSALAYTILVVGDSISAAYGLNEEDGWVQLAEDRLRERVPEVDIVNASISGDTTDGGLRRLPAALDRFEPDLVVIELGGNDGLRAYSIKQMRDNLEGMVAASREAGAQVLLLGMQIPPNYGPAFSSRFAAAFGKVADATNAPLVPFFLEPIATSRDFFQADGIHPTAEAQPLLMEYVIDDIEALMNSDGDS